MALSTQASSSGSLEEGEREAVYDDLAPQHAQAMVLCRQGKFAEAEAILRNNLRILTTSLHLDQDHQDVLRVKNNLAGQLNNQHKCDEAEALHREVLEAHERIDGPSHSNTLIAMSNLAEVFSHQGRYDEAIELQRRTLELCPQEWRTDDRIEQQRSDDENEFDSLLVKENLANTLSRKGGTGAMSESEKLLREVLDGFTQRGGENDPDTLRSMNNLASVLHRKGKCDEAADMYRRVLVLTPEQQPSFDLDRLITTNNLANLLKGQGQYGEAEELYRAAIKLSAGIQGEGGSMTQAALKGLKETLHSRGKVEEADQIKLPSLA